MKLFDTHTHYTDERFAENGEQERDALLASLSSYHVQGVMDCACTENDWPQVRALAAKHDFLWCALGFHGLNATETTKNWQARLLKALKEEKKCAAIGEIGIDYHYEAETAALQRSVFEDQLQIARETGLPVIVHDREAHQDVYAALHRFEGKITGVLHCYSGSAEMMTEHRKLDFYYGFGGSLTFKNNEKGVRAAIACPQDRLLLETDCPYLAPVPFRGKRNHSGLMEYTARRAAELYGIPADELCRRVIENTRRFYRLDSIGAKA